MENEDDLIAPKTKPAKKGKKGKKGKKSNKNLEKRLSNYFDQKDGKPIDSIIGIDTIAEAEESKLEIEPD